MFVLITLIIGLSADGGIIEGFYTALCFIVGSALSAAAGYVGMLIATQANSRTCEACRTSISRGLEVSFASGAVMGNVVVGLGLAGLSVLYVIFTYASSGSMNIEFVPPANGVLTVTYTWAKFSGVFNRLAGFGFGASTIGMFARVGGGVFTKAADVGSDLVGKVEQGIPEDDPRNPAVIADNVGDNVGDVAGMGADLFESYAGACAAAVSRPLLPSPPPPANLRPPRLPAVSSQAPSSPRRLWRRASPRTPSRSRCRLRTRRRSSRTS